jgi:hypothetical protein
MEADIGVENGKAPPSSPSAADYGPVPAQAALGAGRAPRYRSSSGRAGTVNGSP